jgi:glutamine---fructose-6-phosphate transaminase (isomerizing)
MCGIVGYIGPKAASPILLEGLRKLEYRGYDSAGIATLQDDQTVHCVRAKGKLNNLQEKLEQEHNPASIGIGHTRWATHGKPEEHNAHPHRDTAGRIAVVQNGIIENYRDLREQLKAKGCKFVSETDTETIPHLISEHLKTLKASGAPPHLPSLLMDAVQLAVKELQGAFAIAVISADFPDEIIVARQQAPLVLGVGQGEFYCASDTPALVPYTTSILSLDNSEMARMTTAGIAIFGFDGHKVRKSPQTLNWNPVMVEKQGFRHFMLKEIYEQPGVVRSGLEAYLTPDWVASSGRSPIDLGIPPDFYGKVEHINIVACGTSWHAALVGKYLLEQLAGVTTTVQYASEYRYAPPPLTANTLIIGVTQSGETADTLAAIEMEKSRRSGKTDEFACRLMGITNRPESNLGRMVDHIIDTKAGIEIGVAATKTFIAQLMGFYFLSLDLAFRRQTTGIEAIEKIVEGLRQLPSQIESILESQERYIEELSHEFVDTQDFIFLGRGINFPIALEGALKLKEISYIHAEG